MSSQSEQRILECVPKFMSREEQYELLLLSAPVLSNTYAQSQHFSFRSSSSSIDALHRLYSDNIESLKTKTVKPIWFVKNVFTDQEVEEYVECLRYVSIQQQIMSLTAIMQDLQQMLPALNVRGCRVTYYYIDYLTGNRLDVFENSTTSSLGLPVNIPIPPLVSRIGVNNAKMITERMLRFDHRLKAGAGSVVVGVDDIRSFLESIATAHNGPDYYASLIVEGSGGSMHLEVTRKDPALLRKALNMLLILKLTSFTFGLLVTWRLLTSGYWILAVIFGWFSFSMISKIQRKSDFVTSELSYYER